jgi:dihydroorotate dehydrogenase electron transfer subunit
MTHKEKAILQLVGNQRLNADTVMLTLSAAPELTAACQPGQFFNIRTLDSSAPLLRRPISICDARTDAGEIDLVVKTVGEGTQFLGALGPGDSLDVVGPLGVGFSLNPGRPCSMIAGGVGVAPLHFLARRAIDADVAFCYGGRSAADLVLSDTLAEMVAHFAPATEDGSAGVEGYVTLAAEEYLTDERDIFVCGPPGMMNAVLQSMRAKGLRGQFSLENRMGCGVGACQGCVVPGRDGAIRVCCDGPVVDSDELDSIMAV